MCGLKTEQHGHRLPRENVATPSLKVFKDRVDETLSSLLWWVATLITGDSETVSFKVPSNTSQSMIQCFPCV